MRALRLAACALAGLGQAASMAWPWGGQPLWWLQLLSLAGLAALLDAERRHGGSWRRTALSAWLFAMAWLCGTFWWLFISMNTYGGLPAPLAALAVFFLGGGLATYYGVAGGLWGWLAPRLRPGGRVLLFAALWTLAELVRGSLFTGFPWGAGGYAHVDGPLAGYAPWVGVYGIGATAAAIAACVGLWPAQRQARALPVVAAVLLALPLALGALHSDGGDAASTGRLQVALLQGNIPQDEKFVPGAGIETALRWYGDQLLRSRAALVVTPETALPLLPRQLPEGYLAAIATRYAQGSQAAIVGVPMEDGPGRYANSVLGFGPGLADRPYRYDKHHLVPFGEFIPFGFRWFTDMMNIPLANFGRGGLPQRSFDWQGQRIAPDICYEDLFGDEIGAGFRDAANAPTILLNVSNIAWFGDTVAIDQHRAISRMRALEFQRPMLRATNTGATVVIDHRGRVTHELPRLTRGVLEAEVEGRSGITPFAWWVSRFGLAPLWLLSLAVLAFSVWRARTRR
ncbi:apolipoprotein N-acyltransferase [uncultured Pseudacidovorax sp.]|uniref:apolipoprotein N-acyltransferase n=1 Tax=uncultured Pseudacidovorax sp. TaxID=679313 RepID=UPI0025DB456B|nr:apolipoprotein N-acyltransferase [uncultured Pseudacidovorax sp.]